jgi:hypothetical protein
MKNQKNELARLALRGLSPAERRKLFAEYEPPTPRQDRVLLRYGEVAQLLGGITVRSLRYAMQSAGVQPVALPGRERCIGIRAADLDKLVGGGR